jgi:hypothetical protein
MVVVVVDPCLVVVVRTEVVVVEVEVMVVVGQTVSAPCRRQVRRTWRRHFSERLGPTTQLRMTLVQHRCACLSCRFGVSFWLCCSHSNLDWCAHRAKYRVSMSSQRPRTAASQRMSQVQATCGCSAEPVPTRADAEESRSGMLTSTPNKTVTGTHVWTSPITSGVHSSAFRRGSTKNDTGLMVSDGPDAGVARLSRRA